MGEGKGGSRGKVTRRRWQEKRGRGGGRMERRRGRGYDEEVGEGKGGGEEGTRRRWEKGRRRGRGDEEEVGEGKGGVTSWEEVHMRGYFVP